MAQDDPDEKGPREKAAETRTDLAEDRNVMAMERTFAGWLRTAFAAIGIGLGFSALFGSMEPVWVPKAIATVFILAGAWLAWGAQRRTCETMKRLNAHEFDPISAPNFRMLAYAVVGGALMLAGAIWTLQ